MQTLTRNISQLSAVSAPGTASTGQSMSSAEQQTLGYSDPEFELKFGEIHSVSTLNLGVLPQTIKLSSGLDQQGFYFRFDGPVDDERRFYYPCGLKEIKVNGQSIDAELERKWLLESYLAEYRCSFSSVDYTTSARSLLSYFCSLAHMPGDVLEKALAILHKTVVSSTDPYFSIYLCDLAMARLLKALIVRKFKKTVTVEQSEVVSIAEAVLELVKAAASDAGDALDALGQPELRGKPATLMVIPARAKPVQFWSGAYFQLTRREKLVEELLVKLRAEKLLNLLPVPELLLVLAGGNSNLGLKDFLGERGATV